MECEKRMGRLTGKMLVLALIGMIAVVGCGKKEEKKPAQPESAGQVTRKETTVSVPSSVKGKWKAVRIGVTDKSANKEMVYTVEIGGTFKVPNSDLTIKVDNFLPHFVMEGTTLTSQSNEPKNPAAQIRVDESGKEIFKGWLFTLYPNTHAFQHPKYGFALVDFLPAK